MSVFTKRRSVRLSQHRVLDSPFGPIRIDYDRWPAAVARMTGAGIPTVTMALDRQHGALNVGGQSVPTHEGNTDWDPRRKANTRTALVGGRRYELRPTALCRAELRCDERVIGHARGTLRSYGPGRGIPGIDARVTWSPGVDPTDVAVGQAMVLTFGAGAPGALQRVLMFWIDNSGTR
ncbi:hypothetical protein [Streptomyces rubellomurinus]|uniref:Uncharacterized protein n=2 Tax=Streptomyces TaxID=1883 RepID=A0A0F2T6Q8_STRR3|nr:hypothetical protein [Streptomyces rubellomurinus]KJS54015.1 hypothetical protein VM98_21665 [Streptomyces rubellomurinus subsp. indigoferus]KJS58919.1 hypothetical protein VM95_30465 [Streptomyces rubellomurinus]